ncbi:hypothetical protein Dimus_034825 [Dionaea muscipula]
MPNGNENENVDIYSNCLAEEQEDPRIILLKAFENCKFSVRKLQLRGRKKWHQEEELNEWELLLRLLLSFQILLLLLSLEHPNKKEDDGML